jgi:hypothetical protein
MQDIVINFSMKGLAEAAASSMTPKECATLSSEASHEKY